MTTTSTDIAISSTLVEVLESRARLTPEGLGYTFLGEGEGEGAGDSLTFRELDARAREIAAWLQARRLQGRTALLLYPPGLSFIEAFFGCLYAEVIGVPTYPPRGNRVDVRLRAIAVDARPSVVLTSSTILFRRERLVGEAPELGRFDWLATDAGPAADATSWRRPVLKPETLAFLQYTSGSTAEPKGVMVSHGNLRHNAALIRQAFGVTEDSVVVGWLPLYHDMGLIGNVLQPLYAGARAVLMAPMAFMRQPVRWMRAISLYGATLSGGPDFAYALCCRKISPEQRRGLDLSTWEVAFNGAEPVRPATLELFSRTFESCGFHRRAFYPCYGLAEATLFVSGGQRGKGPETVTVVRDSLEQGRPRIQGSELPGGAELVGCGTPLADQEVVVVDVGLGTVCAPGRVGEIWVSGPSVTRGYWQRSEETEAAFHGTLAGSDRRYLRTGDLGFLHAGTLFVTGRLKDLIILRGRNVYPQDLEATAEGSHSALRPAASAAFAVEAEGEEQVVLAIEVERRFRGSPAAVCEAVRRVVAQEHEVVLHEVLLLRAGTLPKTSSGKVKRQASKAAYGSGQLAVVYRSRPFEDIWREAPDRPRPTREEWLALAPAERRRALLADLESRLAAVLGVSAASVEADRSLAELGLHSLAAVELLHQLEEELRLRLPVTLLFELSSLAALAEEVSRRLEASPEAGEYLPEAGEKKTTHPLSRGQRALWFVDRLAPESAAYNVVVAFRVAGRLDLRAFRKALESHVARHPALRSTFVAERGEPVQVFQDRVEVDFEVVEASDESAEELRRKMAAAAYRPFDLEAGPPLRVGLWRRSEHEHAAVVVVHHLISDFWSLAILFDEVGLFYRRPEMARVLPMPLTYADHIRRQERWLDGAQAARSLEYWRGVLAGELPTLTLPTDRPRKPVQSYGGRMESLALGEPLSGSLEALARRRQTTVFNVLLSAFQVLLHRHSNQEDILVGSPAAARGSSELAGVVGYLANPVVLRARISDDRSFRGLLAAGHRRLLEALEHQEYPFPLLVEELVPERDPSRSPIFQVMFSFYETPAGRDPDLAGLVYSLASAGAGVALGDLRLVAEPLPECRSLFDLTLHVAALRGSLRVALVCNRDLFDATTAGRLAGHYRCLLRAAAGAGGEVRVAQLPLASPAEEHQALVEWQTVPTAVPEQTCLHQVIEAEVWRNPQAIAVTSGENRLSYGELNARANRLAHLLLRRGTGPESRVGVLTPPAAELVTGVLAILKAGAAYVPLDTTAPAARLADLVREAGTSLVVAGGPRPPGLRGRAPVWIDAAAEPPADLPACDPECGVRPDNLAYVIYTSGTTGRPKGVGVVHRVLLGYLRQVGGELLAGRAANLPLTTRLTFDASLKQMWVPLLAGRSVRLPPAESLGRGAGGPADPRRLVRWLELVTRNGESWGLNCVPSLWRELLAAACEESAPELGIRALFLGGEAPDSDLVESSFRAFPALEIWNLYGPSEAMANASWKRLHPGVRVSLGRPFGGVRLHVVDRRGRRVVAGVSGELAIGGPGLARGYLERAARTAERFVPDPWSASAGARLFRSGDLVRRLGDGELEYLGRTDRQLKVRGVRLEPGEVEAALAGHPAVERSYVTLERGGGPRRLIAYVVARSTPAPGAAQLRDFLRARLPEILIPSLFVFLEALPLDRHGKVDAAALPPPEPADRVADTGVGPRGPTEELLAEIWEQVLGESLETRGRGPRIAAHDDFFVLGGHSLLATRMISRARGTFGVELPLRAVFEAPTLAGLAARIDAARRPDRAGSGPVFVRLPRDVDFRLSFAQERLWFLDRASSTGAVYNVPALLEFHGELDAGALAAALTCVVRRHEVLRTVFPQRASGPVQHVLTPAPVALPSVDLTALGSRAGRVARHLADAEARRPFVLERGPLLRTCLLSIGPRESWLVLTVHHIVTDGWSMGILAREIRAFYSGGEAGLERLPFQYVDYAAAQHQWLEGEVRKVQLDYWRRRLDGAAALVELPADRPRPSASDSRGDRVALRVPADVRAALYRCAGRQGATLFMVLEAALAVWLLRWSGLRDLTLGTPVANRHHPRTENLIGFFVNMLVLRHELSGETDFAGLLSQARSRALEAFDHQDLPFEVLVEALAPRRAANLTPFCQVVFALQNTPSPELELPGLAIRTRELGTGTAKFDLGLVLRDAQGELGGVFEFRAELFDATTITRTAEHFVTLLREVGSDPERGLSGLAILSVAQRHHVLHEWNPAATPHPGDANLVELFARRVRRAPDACALAFDDGCLSYGELGRRARRIARVLVARGTEPEKPVAVWAVRTPQLYAAILGILEAGGAYVPLDPAYPAERLSFMVDDAGCGVLLVPSGSPSSPHGRERPVPPALEDHFARPGRAILHLETRAGAGGTTPARVREQRVRPENLAYLMYTSGSTGRPKGVGVSHRNVVHLVRGIGYLRLGPAETLVQLAPVSFDASTFEIWGALVNGGRLAVAPSGPPDLPELGSLIRRQRVSVAWLTAGLFHQMVASELPALAGVSQLLTGGDVVAASAARRVIGALRGAARLFDLYGPTETTTFATCHAMDGLAAPRGSVPIGRPIDRVRLAVVDRRAEPVPVGAPGELWIGGAGVSRGYWRRPGRTAAVFVPEPFGGRAGERCYRSGDRVRHLADGKVEFLGRMDQQVKIRGFRVEPREVETVLDRHPGVQKSAVVLSGRGEGKSLVAYVVAGRGDGPETAALRDYLRSSLPEYMVPSTVVPVASLPLTRHGKLDVSALPPPAPEHSPDPGRALLSPTEELLAGIWESVLEDSCEAEGRDRLAVGAQDDFFALGGHSLLATRMISEVRRAFNVEIGLRAVFEAPTLAGLAARVDATRRSRAEGTAPSFAPVVRDGDLPLSFSQERLWFLDQLTGGGAVYNVPVLLELEGELHPARLASALGQVVERHEALRTVFPQTGEGPVQRILPAVPAELPRLDLTALGNRAPGVARRLADELARQVFDLEHGPLFKACLLRLGPRRNSLVLNVHHIVTDGWSMGILAREIRAFYPEGVPRPEPLPIQYADYAAGQRKWLEGEVGKGQLEYWRNRLDGAPAVLELPTDRLPAAERGDGEPAPADATFRGGRRLLRLSPAVSGRLARLARQRRATLFMALETALAALVARWAGLRDLTLGTPIANRHHPETEGLVGFFVNTLVLRHEIPGDVGFGALLDRARDHALDAFDHQDLPFEALVADLAPQRDPELTPFCQLFFALQNVPDLVPELPGLSIRTREPATGTAKFHLSLLVRQEPGRLSGRFEYRSAVFDATTIARCGESFAHLLEAVSDDPDRKLSRISLLSPAQRQQLFLEWQPVITPFPRDAVLPELFGQEAERSPEACALVFGDRNLSYRELRRRAHAIARVLRRRGVGPETPVAIWAVRSPELYVAIVGILEAGGAYVPLDPSYPARRLSFLAADSGAEVLVAPGTGRGFPLPEALRRWFEEPGRSILRLAAAPAGLPEPGRGPVPGTVHPGSLAYLMYTSGSTGRPKGIAVTHRNVIHLVRGVGYARLGPGQSVLQFAPVPFDPSTFEIWGALLHGGRLVAAPPGLPGLDELGALIRRQRISVLWLTTGLFHQMVENEPESLAGPEEVSTAGDVLSATAARRMISLLRGRARFSNLYGPTETTVFATGHAVGPRSEIRGTVPIGRPLDRVRVVVVDRRAYPVPVGAPGELWIGGEGVSRGYWGRPGRTAAAFVPDPFAGRPDPLGAELGRRAYRSGDRARQLHDGRIEFLGRLDQQVKIRGFRVEPGEVETVLGRHPLVRSSAVVVHRHGGDRRLVAYVVCREGPAPATEELRRHLRAALPEYMVPAAFVPLAGLPLTPHGKVDAAALPPPEPSGRPVREDEAARSPTEEILAGIWAGVLGGEGRAPAVGVHDDFFALGGHSLLATRVLSEIRRSFGVAISLSALFKAPTLAELAARVDQARRSRSGAGGPRFLPVPRGNDFPLSYAQERLWFLDQLSGGTPIYNVPTLLELRGELDPGILEGILGHVVRRHEVLRTVFPQVAGEPVQHILPPAGVELPLVDLTALGRRAAPIGRALARALAVRPFDLARGPLVRACLLRVTARESLLFLGFHHIVTDGWSLGILTREIRAFYPGAGGARPGPMHLQYADYALAQRRWLEGEAGTGQLEHWRRRLAGAPAVLELPVDRVLAADPGGRAPSFRGATRRLRLDGEVRGGLKQLATRRRATLFMVLEAGLAALLARWTGHRDLTLGTPIANRHHPATEELIGFFVNTLVLRHRFTADPDFAGVLAEARDQALDAFDHQDLPFEALIEDLAPRREAETVPFCRVVVALQNVPAPELALPELRIRASEIGTGTAKFDLSVIFRETADEIHGTVEYRRELFDPATIARWAEYLGTLLREVGADPSRKLSRIPLLCVAQRQQVLLEWNPVAEAGCPRAAILPELFEDQAARRPDACALVFEERSLTYGELDRRACRVARVLAERGVGAETPVAIWAIRSPELYVGILGILEAGGVYVPLDPSYPAARLEFLAEDAGADVLLVPQGPAEDAGGNLALSLVHHFTCPGRSILRLDATGHAGRPVTSRAPRSRGRAHPENLAYLMYTSGSTGRPKGIGVTHRNVIHLVRGVRYAAFGPEHSVLQFTPASFDPSILEIWGALLHGARLVVVPPAVPPLDELGRLIRSRRVSLIVVITGLFHQMVESEVESLAAVEQVFVGGDVLSVAGARRMISALWGGGRFTNLYGPTETTTCVSFHAMDAAARLEGTVPLGRPLDRIRLMVVDRQARPVPIGAPGELWIAGDGLSRGYWRRPGRTAAAFVPVPFAVPSDRAALGRRCYRTGDRVRQRHDGRVEFLHRLDQQVKIRGFRVEPGEVETALDSHPQVMKSAVVALRRGGEKRLVAYVVGRRGQAMEVDGLRAHLRARLPHHMVPAIFVPLDELPLTAHHKVDLDALPEPPEATSTAGGQRAGGGLARTPIEAALREIWAEVLAVEGLGVHDNFFDLGGHSLLATRLMARVRSTFRVDLPLSALFEKPTVAGLSKLVRETLADGEALGDSRLEPVPRQSVMPLSFAQERIWFLDQLEPGKAAYNMPAAVRLGGRLDPRALEHSLSEVVRRHEVLRATFRMATLPGETGERPVQTFAPPRPIRLPRIDLESLPGPRMRDAVRELSRREAQRPFDLERGPLVRGVLLRSAAEDHVLLLNLHHIVSDGESVAVLIREMGTFYAGALAGRTATPAPLPVQYADFAVWQRRWLDGGPLTGQLAYWRRRLADVRPLELPTDAGGPAGSQRGRREARRLPQEVSRQLRAQASRRGATLFMTLLAALQVLLHRWTGQEDFTIGSPISARSRPELEGLIGLFLNNVVLRADVSGEPSFAQLLERVRRGALEAYVHQDVPFEKLVEELAPRRDLGHHPLFDVLLNVATAPAAVAELPGLEVTTLRAEGLSSKFAMTLYAGERGGRLELDLVYRAALFSRRRMACFMDQLIHLLAQVAEDATKPITEYSLVTPEAAAVLGDPAAPLARPGFPAVSELVARHQAEAPERTALTWREACRTYRWLGRRSAELARHLAARGPGPGEVVALVGRRSFGTIVGVLGILASGRVLLALDPRLPPARRRLMLETAGARLLLDLTDGAARTETEGPPRLEVEPMGPESGRILAAPAGRPAPADLPPPAPPGEAAYVFFTSGTTGVPKGVLGSHQGLSHFLVWQSRRFGVGAGDRSAQLTGLSFDVVLRDIFLPLVSGGTLCLPDELDELRPEKLLPWFEERRITLLHAVPAVARSWLAGEAPEAAAATLRQVFFAGEPLTGDLVRRFRRSFPGSRVANLYGPTETTLAKCCYEVPAEPADGVQPLGRPLPQTQALVLSPRGRQCGLCEPGEIVIRTPFRSLGYLSGPTFAPNPSTTREDDRLYFTGDLGRYRPDGLLEILGRADGQVKVRGVRVWPVEVEGILGRHPDVREALVRPGTDAAGETTLVAYVVGRERSASDAGALREFLARQLPEALVPSAFVSLERIPLNANGKVDLPALPRPAEARPVTQVPREAPRGSLERRIAEAWCEILGLDAVGAHDNFFEVGGHSLLLVRLRRRLEEVLGREIDVVDLFRHPTVRALSRHLEGPGEAESEPTTVEQGRDRAARRKALSRRRKSAAAGR